MAKPPIGVMGAGWVGLVASGCFAELGHDVIVRDVVPDRIDALARGETGCYEPGLAELLIRNASRLRFTLEAGEVFERASLVFVCVGTPATASGDADLSAVWQLVEELPSDARNLTLVMKSTVPVGTGERIRAELDDRRLEHVGYVSNPEFLSEGTALDDFMHPDRVVVGTFSEQHGRAVADLYAGLEAPVVVTDVSSAEMIKYASNAFLATKISFINEIANVCEETGADVEVVAEGMGLDQRIGSRFLRAGIGYGGSCFPKDVSALKQLAGNSGYHFQLLNAVIEVNELQKRRVLTKLKWHLGSLEDRAIALLGASFKPDTNDVREAPSLVLASRLAAEGAWVRVWDPVALPEIAPLVPPGTRLEPDMLEALRGVDAAVVVTEWPAVRDFPFAAASSCMSTRLIVDGRNALDPTTAREAGFVYEGIGRRSRTSPLDLQTTLRSAARTERRPAPVPVRA